MLRRSLFTTLGAGLALSGVLAGSARAEAISPELAGTYAAGWLGRTMDPTGYVPSLGGADYSTTAYAVLALVAAEVGEAQAAEATSYLFSHVEEFVSPDADDVPGAIALLIMVGEARGLDTSALVTRLLATKQATGDDAGLFGSQDATYDGAYRQSLALLALDAAGTTDADAVAWLKGEQCSDGGWMGNRPEGAECPAFDMNTFVGEDSNGTALATQALLALGETPAHDPLEFLAEAQNSDGGFGFVPGFDSDANSTALAIQALIALGEDLADWEAPEGTPYDLLLSLQLGNPPATTAGALSFQGGTLKANAFATAQAVPALMGKPYPIAPATLSAGLPLLPAAPVATPSATVAPTAAPTAPTAAPSVAPTRVVDAAPVPELPATGGVGEKPWDAKGLLVFGLGLIGYGVLALGGARWARGRTAR